MMDEPDVILPRGTPVTHRGVPTIVAQALNDRRLSRDARLMMWALLEQLDFLDFREIVPKQIGGEMGIARPQASRALRELVEEGYLVMRWPHRNTRVFRFPFSRGPAAERAPRKKPRGKPFERLARDPEIDRHSSSNVAFGSHSPASTVEAKSA